MLPVAYRSANLIVQPAPSNVPPNEMEQNENGEEENPLNEEEQNGGAEEVIGANGVIQNEESDEDEKVVLPIVHMDSTDVMAVDNVLDDTNDGNYSSTVINMNEQSNELEVTDENDNNDNVSADQMHSASSQPIGTAAENQANNEAVRVSAQHNNSVVQSYVPAADEQVNLIENGQMCITKVFADGMEMTYIHGQKLRARKDPYQIKVNDVLSGNLPFQENVCITIFHCRPKYTQIIIFRFYSKRKIVRTL